MKLTPLYRVHKAAGAAFGDIDGWQMPQSFSGPEKEAAHIRRAVGVADLSHRTKLDSPSQPEQKSWRLGPKHYLAVDETPFDARADMVNVTGAYAEVLLAGPRVRNVIAKLCSLDTAENALPDQSCAQASFAHAHAILFRSDINGIPAIHVLVGRDYAESVWESIVHAGQEHEIALAGLEALKLLESTR